MNLYITVEDRAKVKKAFLNLRKQLIIEVRELIEQTGYDPDKMDKYSSFIISQRIKRLVQTTANGNKVQSIVYVNPDYEIESIRELIHFVQEETSVEKVIFLTEKGKNEDMYELFEEVSFYPSVKKVHIIHLEPVPVVWLDQ
jgi:hypothetical protein